MIYVPDYVSSNCVVVRNEEVIRRYETTPTFNSNISYTDYYIHSDYIKSYGVQNFGAYASLPTCTPANMITTDFYYRVDFYKILIMFTIFVLFGIYLPFKIIIRFFRRLR